MPAYGRPDLPLDNIDVLNNSIQTEIPEQTEALPLQPNFYERRHVHLSLRSDFPIREIAPSDICVEFLNTRKVGNLDALLKKNRPKAPEITHRFEKPN